MAMLRNEREFQLLLTNQPERMQSFSSWVTILGENGLSTKATEHKDSDLVTPSSGYYFSQRKDEKLKLVCDICKMTEEWHMQSSPEKEDVICKRGKHQWQRMVSCPYISLRTVKTRSKNKRKRNDTHETFFREEAGGGADITKTLSFSFLFVCFYPRKIGTA